VVKDIRVQILADGMLHVLMYRVALWGLTLLWRHSWQFALPSAGRYLFACAVLGFGGWNVIDIGLFHWILAIHRIPVDSSHPLFWDLLWLGLVFKLMEEAEKPWRKVRGADKLKLLLDGVPAPDKPP